MSINSIGGGPNYAALVQRAAARRAASTGQGASRTSQASRTTAPNAAQGASAPQASSRVGQAVDGALQQVSDFQNHADKMVIDLATGRDTNIHNTMVELEKADIALKYTVQLRNRALSAYEELMRMQV